jgi:hypothetical protein
MLVRRRNVLHLLTLRNAHSLRPVLPRVRNQPVHQHAVCTQKVLFRRGFERMQFRINRRRIEDFPDGIK